MGNDNYGKGLPYYDTSIPQRTQDLEKAKSLLKAAGKEGLKVTLNTSTVATGMVESATVFARQAAGAGVTVTLNQQPPNIYFGPVYLKQNFAQSEWFTLPILNQYAQSLVNGAPFNETHWHNPQFQSLYDQALAETDAGKRQDLYSELQTLLWNDGGYLIWGFYPVIDGLSKQVGGIEPSPLGPLGGRPFTDTWLTAYLDREAAMSGSPSQGGGAIVDFDPLKFYEAPYPIYRDLRETAPVLYIESRGAWVLSRYATVQAAAR